MIWSYAKPFNEKMRDNRFFNTFNQWYKNRKNTNLSCWYKNTQQKPKPNGLQPKGLQLYWKDTPTQVFLCEISKIFKNTFS